MLTTLLTIGVILTGILAGYVWVTVLGRWLGTEDETVIECIEVLEDER